MSAGLKMTLEKVASDPVSAFNVVLLLEEEHKGPKTVQYFSTIFLDLNRKKAK